MSMSTVYTSDVPQVGVAIAQPAGTPQRSVVGGWGCELKSESKDGEGRWGLTCTLKETSILPQSLFILYAYVSIYVSMCVCISF